MTQQSLDDALAQIPFILETAGIKGVYSVNGDRVRIEIGTQGEDFRVVTFNAFQMVECAVKTLSAPPIVPAPTIAERLGLTHDEKPPADEAHQ